jgi:UrcA family protein
MKIQVLAAFAAVCFCAPVAALADEPVQSVKVSLAGADPATPAGHAEAVKRITKAAMSLCREAPGDPNRLMAQLMFETCVKQSAAPAIASLRPVTPAVEMARTGR